MMKKTVSILCVAVMLMMMLSLAACGNSGGQDISGSYLLVEMTVDGEDMTPYLSLLGDVTLTVESDKATLEMYGESTELTVDTAAMTMTGEDGMVQAYTVSGNTIAMEEDGTKMVFEKK